MYSTTIFLITQDFAYLGLSQWWSSPYFDTHIPCVP